ncbi:MAG: hypothetical protein ACM3XR_00470 [Bacillota bacterium]
MKLDIALTDSIAYDCFEGLIVSFAEWENRDYRLAHAIAWDFTVNYEIREDPPVTLSFLGHPRALEFDLKNIIVELAGVILTLTLVWIVFY